MRRAVLSDDARSVAGQRADHIRIDPARGVLPVGPPAGVRRPRRRLRLGRAHHFVLGSVLGPRQGHRGALHRRPAVRSLPLFLSKQ